MNLANKFADSCLKQNDFRMNEKVEWTNDTNMNFEKHNLVDIFWELLIYNVRFTVLRLTLAKYRKCYIDNITVNIFSLVFSLVFFLVLFVLFLLTYRFYSPHYELRRSCLLTFYLLFRFSFFFSSLSDFLIYLIDS